MLRKMNLNGKILGSIALTLLLTSAVSYWVTQRRVNQQAEEAFRDKVRVVAGIGLGKGSGARGWRALKSGGLGLSAAEV